MGVINGQAFADAARQYIGVQWGPMGRTKKRLDCGGLILFALRDCGLDPHDPAPYGPFDFNVLLDWLGKYTREAPWHPLKPGMLAVVRPACSSPPHLAIITDIGLIHSDTQARKVVEHRLDKKGLRSIVSVHEVIA